MCMCIKPEFDLKSMKTASNPNFVCVYVYVYVYNADF